MRLIDGLYAAVAMLFALATTSVAHGQLFVLDFEGLPEETAISDQFADLGVTFSIVGEPDLLPIIAVEGSPAVAFTGSGTDRPMASLAGGLTDPIIDGNTNAPNDIALDFDPPVTSLRLFIMDIDTSDEMSLVAFDGEKEVDRVTIQAGDPGTGNGRSTEFRVAAPSITRAEVQVVGDVVGWALDFVTFTRLCEGPGCGVQIQIAQESAPGADDFDDNVLGFLRPFPFSGSAAEFYAYNVPEGDSWNGPALTPEADRSHLVFAGSAVEGLTLYVVHDRAFPNDPDGGRAETSYELSDPDGAERTVEDDPEVEGVDFYTGEPGDTFFTAAHSWNACCTDGLALSGLDCRSTTIMQFTDVDENPNNATIDGLLDWFAYSATGEQIELALEADRRVRLIIFPDPECPADLDCTDRVDFNDLLILLATWGPCPSCPEDISGNGDVGFDDLLLLLADWGPCGG